MCPWRASYSRNLTRAAMSYFLNVVFVSLGHKQQRFWEIVNHCRGTNRRHTPSLLDSVPHCDNVLNRLCLILSDSYGAYGKGRKMLYSGSIQWLSDKIMWGSFPFLSLINESLHRFQLCNLNLIIVPLQLLTAAWLPLLGDQRKIHTW